MSDEKRKSLRILNVEAFETASHFVSKDVTRENINGVYIDKDGSVTATDGHTLFHVPKCVEPPEKSFTMQLARPFPKIKDGLPVVIDLERHVISVDMDSMGRAEWKKGQPVKLSYAEFPDYKQIIPDKADRQPVAHFNMAPKLLIKIAKSVGKCPMMTFFGGKDEMSVIQIEVSSLPDAIILIMPMRA